jgi:hypothetical protein
MSKSTAALRAWAIPSASRTATAGAIALKNDQGHAGLALVVDVTTAGTGSITAYIRAVLADGNKRTLLASAAITTAITTIIQVYPAGPDTANSRSSIGCPLDVEVEITHGNANAIVYSAEAWLIP